MRLTISIAIACLAALISVNSASAQVVHELSVGHHPGFSMGDTEVDRILDEASTILGRCKVTLKRKGVVQPFASASTPPMISNPPQRDAVHAEHFDVKVVTNIGFCRFAAGHAGCAWDPPPEDPDKPRRRSMIVEHIPTAVSNTNDESEKLKLLGVVWAHEFGHMTGLWHRSEPQALMSMCKLKKDQIEIGEAECSCYVGGRDFCNKNNPEPLGGISCSIAGASGSR